MIKNNTPLSMVEATEYLKNAKDEGADLTAFIRQFTKLSPAKAKELKEKLKSLDMIKMDDRYISKIIDILPETSEDLNKIFSGIGLNEEETEQIFGAIKGFK
jgi:DNA-directed RNA polymerase subunit F